MSRDDSDGGGAGFATVVAVDPSTQTNGVIGCGVFVLTSVAKVAAGDRPTETASMEVVQSS